MKTNLFMKVKLTDDLSSVMINIIFQGVNFIYHALPELTCLVSAGYVKNNWPMI